MIVKIPTRTKYPIHLPLTSATTTAHNVEASIVNKISLVRDCVTNFSFI